jgi:hypothetical protein
LEKKESGKVGKPEFWGVGCRVASSQGGVNGNLGLDVLTGASGQYLYYLSNPQYELKAVAALGSKPGSSIISTYLRNKVNVQLEKSVVTGLKNNANGWYLTRSANLGGVLGRYIGGAAYGLGLGLMAWTVYDIWNSDFREAFTQGAGDFYQIQREAYQGNPMQIVCFTKGTLVLATDGLKPIENIIVGDSIYSYNIEKNTIESSKVAKTFKSQSQEIFEVVTGNEKVMVTAQHPFYVEGKGWVKVKDLQIGDSLKTRGNNKEQIANITKCNRDEDVYNIEVEGNHNYFVTNSNILVHNK